MTDKITVTKKTRFQIMLNTPEREYLERRRAATGETYSEIIRQVIREENERKPY